MSASQSNLSDPHYGFDLVVAVTQASINATLEQYLAGLSSPEVTICYVYDDNDNLVPVDYHTLVSDAHGSDPFSVPDGANPQTNQDLINLAAANFAGAVRAKIGLPNVELANLPPIATLGSGSSAPVLFNLLCSEFQITGFEYGPRGRSTWISQAQPTGAASPWYFSANVSLNNTTIDPNSPVPPAVQQRIAQLQHDPTNAFSIQKLFLDLDTAILESSPSIQGVPPGWPVWSLITTVFLGSYFGQLRQTGDPVLNYSFTLAAPRTATLELGSVSRECSPLLDDGQPITNSTPAQQAATALVYIGSTSTTPPIPVPFAWNWVELGEVSSFSGVQAVRRDVFFTYFAGLLNGEVGPLSIDTTVHLSHSGEDFTVRYTSRRSATPASFRPVANVGPADADGFTTLLTINYNHNSHDDSTSATHMVEIWGDYNYTLTGNVAVKNNQVRIQVQAQAHMKFAHREVFVNYTDLDGANYYDKTLTVVYTLGVGQDGTLQVAETHSVADHSAPWSFDPQGIIGKLGLENDVKNGVTSIANDLTSVIDASFTNYLNQLTAVINGYRGWVFAGNDAFTFKNVAFSAGQDLVAQLTYVNPN